MPRQTRGASASATQGGLNKLGELPPNFRNLGSLLRMMLVVNFLALLTVLVRLDDWSGFAAAFVLMAGQLEMPLFVAMLVLYIIGPWLERHSWRFIMCIVVGIGIGLASFSSYMLATPEAPNMAHRICWAGGAALFLLAYFRWRQLRQTPALAEARMLALNARIRPHFFFNSLNGVLGVIRSDPKRAEQALESLADLFRTLMQENRKLVSLGDEIELCNRYLELERLRLGERLQVIWDVKYVPLDARVPPLMLQPLIENAVYHGVEPSTEPATITICIRQRGAQLALRVSNPVVAASRAGRGNRMALDNIRERLMLFFDLEAVLQIEEKSGMFNVLIRFPLRHEASV